MPRELRQVVVYTLIEGDGTEIEVGRVDKGEERDGEEGTDRRAYFEADLAGIQSGDEVDVALPDAAREALIRWGKEVLQRKRQEG